jgi:cell division protein FtsI (penicillin-binding protein 3)
VWLVRHLTPKQQYSVNALGIPGIYLQQDQKRIYPYGIMLSHVLGYCGTDNIGLSGIEKYFDLRLRKDKTPLVLSVDLRLQHVIHEELKDAIQEFSALAGNAMLVDLETGEILAMVSLPDFDPNQPNLNAPESIFNRNTLGVYEPGSVFKVFNTAAALETGRIKLSSVYDASHPIKVGRFTITDFKGQNRPLTVEETFMFSSNIASAKMALDFGGEWQRKCLAQFGLFSKPSLEIPEIGAPIVAKHWTEANTISTAFGYSISVSPLQTLRGVAAVLTRNFRDFTLLHQKTPILATDIVSEKTSAAIKHLMKLVTTKGTATKANVPGYPILGKTGSAHKLSGRSYHKQAKVTSLIGVFPESSPRYILMVMLDAPQPTKNTYGYSTAGWNAAPTGGKIIGRIAPILGLTPDFESSIQQENPVKMVNHYIPD